MFRNQPRGWTLAYLDMMRTILRTRCFGNGSLRPGRGTNARGQALSRCLCLVAASVALAAYPGRCQAAEAVAAPAEPREFAVKGVVKKVEPENSRVIIAHEAIPGFMDAMTMPFRVKAPEILAAVQAGDSVSFRLSVTTEQSWIDNVVKIPAINNSSATATNPEPTEAAVSTVAPRHWHPLLDYAFTNELGQPVRLGEFRGQVLAMTFFFSRCPIPDYCPRLMKNFEEASLKLRNMPDAPTNYHFLSVTFDPEFDTPARLKAYAKGYGYDPSHWSFLTGPAEKVAELARLSDMKYQRDGAFFNHDLRTLIIDGGGRLRMIFPVGGNLSGAIVEEILKAAAPTNQPVQQNIKH
jgi:protein SCO1